MFKDKNIGAVHMQSRKNWIKLDFLVGGKKFVGVKEKRDKVRTRDIFNLLCFVKK